MIQTARLMSGRQYATSEDAATISAGAVIASKYLSEQGGWQLSAECPRICHADAVATAGAGKILVDPPEAVSGGKTERFVGE